MTVESEFLIKLNLVGGKAEMPFLARRDLKSKLPIPDCIVDVYPKAEARVSDISIASLFDVE